MLGSQSSCWSRRIDGGGAPVATIVTVFSSPSLNTSGGTLEKTGAVPAVSVTVWRASPPLFFARSVSVYRPAAAASGLPESLAVPSC